MGYNFSNLYKQDINPLVKTNSKFQAESLQNCVEVIKIHRGYIK